MNKLSNNTEINTTNKIQTKLIQKNSAPETIGYLTASLGTVSVLNDKINLNTNYLSSNKWDFEKNELTCLNLQLTNQILFLKNKLAILIKKQNDSIINQNNETNSNKNIIISNNQNDETKLLNEIYFDLDKILTEKDKLNNSYMNYSANSNENLFKIESNKKLFVENKNLKKLLDDAKMELEIYRKEPSQNVCKQLMRCNSAVELSNIKFVSFSQQEIKKLAF